MAESASSSFELDARLHVTAHEQGQTRQFPIGVPTVENIELVIGRSRSVDLTIHDEYISNRHLKIVFRNGEHWLEDLGSTHGTTVNGEPVKAPRLLKSGDIVSLGKSSFEYRCSRRPLEDVGSIVDYVEPAEPAKGPDANETQPEQATGVTMAQQATVNATKLAAAKAASEEKPKAGTPAEEAAKAKATPATTTKSAATPNAKPQANTPGSAARPAEGKASGAPEKSEGPGFIIIAAAALAVIGILALVCYLAWQMFFANGS